MRMTTSLTQTERKRQDRSARYAEIGATRAGRGVFAARCDDQLRGCTGTSTEANHDMIDFGGSCIPIVENYQLGDEQHGIWKVAHEETEFQSADLESCSNSPKCPMAAADTREGSLPDPSSPPLGCRKPARPSLVPQVWLARCSLAVRHLLFGHTCRLGMARHMNRPGGRCTTSLVTPPQVLQKRILCVALLSP